MNNTVPKIILCDDDGRRVRRWAEMIGDVAEISEKFSVVAWTPDQFAEAFSGLKDRQRAGRDESKSTAVGTSDILTQLDEATFVVVDFDLTPMNNADALQPTTLATLSGSFGDQVAFLMRYYSDVPVTILVNEGFYQSTFDLTHEAFAHSSADVNVAHNDLGRRELWTGRSDGRAFRPWQWPRLIDVPERFRNIAVSLNLDEPILSALGLDDDSTLDQFASGQLDLFGPDPTEVTFRDAVDFPSELKGLSRPEPVPEEHLRGVAVAAVSHWLERIVLPAQNVLVDAPHLAQRRPGLLTNSDPTEWGLLTDLSQPEAAKAMFLPGALDDAAVAALDPWLSRPAWLWHKCPRARIRAAGAPHAFCEDVSAFHPLDDVVEYRSSVPGPFSQRFVLREPVSPGLPVNYWPNARLFAVDSDEAE